MFGLWNYLSNFLKKNIKFSPTENAEITRKEAILTLLCALFCLFNRIHIDPTHFIVQGSAVYDVDHKSLFEFINHAATVERWFQWVSHFQSLDRQPPGVGKQYRAYFYIAYVGYEKIDFRVASYSADSHIVLESSHALEPALEASVMPLDSRRTLLTMSITFKQGSLLYQLTVGTYLRYLASKHMKDAFLLLNSTC